MCPSFLLPYGPELFSFAMLVIFCWTTHTFCFACLRARNHGIEKVVIEIWISYLCFANFGSRNPGGCGSSYRNLDLLSLFWSSWISKSFCLGGGRNWIEGHPGVRNVSLSETGRFPFIVLIILHGCLFVGHRNFPLSETERFPLGLVQALSSLLCRLLC